VDHRRWAAQIDAFSQQYRVIAYSRRYNYPNRNGHEIPDYSAIVDADDLAGILGELKLPRCHIVAESYGAYAALFLTVRHPELVRTLVLSEAPILSWLETVPQGKQILDEFMTGFWQPLGEVLRGGDRTRALNLIVAHFLPGAQLSDITPELRAVLEDNLHEWELLTTSRDAFPKLSREAVASINCPVLLLSGEQTLEEHKIIDAELEKALPAVRRIVVPGTTHEMWDEQPDACRKHTLDFLSEH
jgi:pimeloyl-ACP methyl ester carboxylesterase